MASVQLTIFRKGFVKIRVFAGAITRALSIVFQRPVLTLSKSDSNKSFDFITNPVLSTYAPLIIAFSQKFKYYVSVLFHVNNSKIQVKVLNQEINIDLFSGLDFCYEYHHRKCQHFLMDNYVLNRLDDKVEEIDLLDSPRKNMKTTRCRVLGKEFYEDLDTATPFL